MTIRLLRMRLSLAIAAGCYATLLLFLQRGDGSPRSSFTRAIDFALFNLCLFLVAAEFVLGAWAAVQPSPILTRLDPGPAQVVPNVSDSVIPVTTV